MELKDLLRINILKKNQQDKNDEKIVDMNENTKKLSDNILYCFNEVDSKISSMNEANKIDINLNLRKGGIIKRFLKKMVRKLTWWILQPIVTQQKWYNELNNFSLKMLLMGQKNSYHLFMNLNSEIKDIINCKDIQIEELRRMLEEIYSELQDKKEQERIFQLWIEEEKKCICLLEEKVNHYLQNNYMNGVDYMDGVIDYTHFQEKFRGSYEEIKNRLYRYKDYFSRGDVVLDVGCGRGEMLEILKEVEAKPIGVDRNETTVKQCTDRGYTVYNEDAFVYLKNMYDDFFDGITCIQMIEHISTRALVEFVILCKMKLKQRGILILETPNPKVISTFAVNFYVDPTHIRPVHPEFLKYVLEENGFYIVKEDYPEYSWVTDGTIPKIRTDGMDTRELNNKIDYLNNLLYGSTDYAIIAKKK